MQHILNSLIVEIDTGSPCIVATIIQSSGSTPRTSGARMLVKEDGSVVGSVGGGAIEGRCIAAAIKIFTEDSDDVVLKFDLMPNDDADLGMVCGGAVSVLLQRADGSYTKLFQKLKKKYTDGAHPVLLSHLPYKGKKAYFSILEDEDVGTKQKVEFHLRQQPKETRFMFFLEEKPIFIETLIQPGTVYLMGAGHVAHAVAKLAKFTHFEVVVTDDRPEFANAERYPDAKEIIIVDKFENCFLDLSIDDYVIIVTRGHTHDRDVLAEALKTNAGYIGMIGSRRKIRAVYDSILKSGFCEKDLDRVSSPIGINIKADTPEEIAVSIIAELIQTRANR